MWCLAPILAALGVLAGCANAPVAEEYTHPAARWYPKATGCEDEYLPDYTQAQREVRDFFGALEIMVLPDVPAHVTFLAMIDVSERQPEVQFSLQRSFSTKVCSVRMPLANCPAARAARDALLALPLGTLAVPEVEGFILHAPTYRIARRANWQDIELRVGEAADSDWPERIRAFRDATQSCWQPALDAMEAAGPPSWARP